ncbi:MAG TPA: fatty acid--CoA ligase family protein [Actinomycetota bacterium]|nr:fatty acid--CoA ligase family protein [Actinomycetota bacterium]
MSETRLVALRYPNRRLAARLYELWDEGLAALPISPALPDTEVRTLLQQLRPSRLEDESGTVALAGGIPVEEDVALVVPTSGASGAPKGVELSFRALEHSARAYQGRLGIRPGDRWLCCLPLSHIGGLGILARSRFAGAEPVVHDRFDPSAVAAERRTTLISLVPTTLARLLEAGVDLSGYRAVLVGGAGLPDALAARARDAGYPVVSTYGMTETCGGCNFDGIPLDGVEIRIEDEQIAVRSPSLMERYRLNPKLTAETLRDGWLHTADRGEIGSDGKLKVLGRADDVIVTGGEKVSAAEVEALLLLHPNIADAAVAGIRDEEWGQAVAALVVPKSGVAPSAADLRDFLSSRAARHKAPRTVLEADRVPRTATGKVRRGEVRAVLVRGGTSE